jgi:sarcosine oxidase subunit beta
MDDAPIVRVWAGTDGYSPDGVAIIGPSPRQPGLFHACCQSGHGFATGPAIGGVMADLVQGRTPEVDISGLDPGRFQGTAHVSLAPELRTVG